MEKRMKISLGIPRPTALALLPMFMALFGAASTEVCAQDLSDEVSAIIDTLVISQLSDLDFDPDSGLLIGDGRELTVWNVQDSRAPSMLHSPGQGPGEYMSIASLEWGPGGTIYVSDRTNGRVNTYSSDFTFQDYLRQAGVEDIAVTQDGDVYCATTLDSRGVVILHEDLSEEGVPVDSHPKPESVDGLPNLPMYKRALLQWDEESSELVVGYTIDAYFEIVQGAEVVRSFQIESEYVDENLTAMRDNKGGPVLNVISSLLSFCVVGDGLMLLAVGGEIILSDTHGQVFSRSPKPKDYKLFYAGPNGRVLGVNRMDYSIETFRIADLFPQYEPNRRQIMYP